MTNTKTRDDVLTKFAERLNEALDEMEFFPTGKGRQTRLSKEFGISQQGARKWLTGESLPEIDKGIALAKMTGVRFEWLYTGRGPKREEYLINPPQNQDTQERQALYLSGKELMWLDILRRLSGEQQDLFRSLAGFIVVEHPERRHAEAPDGKPNERKTYFAPLMSEPTGGRPITKTKISRWNIEEEKTKVRAPKEEKKS